jgi:fluoroquinolone transport system permease protein
MKNLATQLKWQMLILTRNNIISISFLVTFAYVAIFLGIRDLGNADKLLTLFVLNDPAIIGLFFMGVAFLIERRQQVLSALFVTPVDHHIYIWSRVISLSIVGLICALVMAVAAVGFNFNWLHFSLGVFGISIICCLIGLYLACFTSEFLKLMLGSIPILLLVLNPPLLNYFEVTSFFPFNLMPIAGGIWLLDNAMKEVASSTEILMGYISMAIWIGITYVLVYRTFMKKIVNA